MNGDKRNVVRGGLVRCLYYWRGVSMSVLHFYRQCYFQKLILIIFFMIIIGLNKKIQIFTEHLTIGRSEM